LSQNSTNQTATFDGFQHSTTPHSDVMSVIPNQFILP